EVRTGLDRGRARRADGAGRLRRHQAAGRLAAVAGRRDGRADSTRRRRHRRPRGGGAVTSGLDPASLRSFLDAAAPGYVGGDLSVRLPRGGRPPLTYSVSGGSRRFLLRRPPLGHVLSTAHDMGREFTVLSALATTPVPVPRTVALCADESVIGAPFYVM